MVATTRYLLDVFPLKTLDHLGTIIAPAIKSMETFKTSFTLLIHAHRCTSTVQYTIIDQDDLMLKVGLEFDGINHRSGLQKLQMPTVISRRHCGILG